MTRSWELELVEDPKWELAILATVQGFYEKLLQPSVGGEVPVPAGLEAVSLQNDENVGAMLASMHRWLRLLDLAINPAMLRRAFTPDTDPEIAEALLRYFIRQPETGDAHRDKTDLVSTFLYRHPRVAGQWERRGFGLDGSLPLAPFEIALIEILSEGDVPSLPDEQMQLLRQFDRLQEEANHFRDLNTLLDSGIIPRVRELKALLGPSFYHPSALAAIAPYNTVFGKRFDELFLRAAGEIRHFAEALEQQGGSILGTVDGLDVTVEHVAALEESELLRIDYGIALEKFRRVSRLRKTLEQSPPLRRAPATARPAGITKPDRSATSAAASVLPRLDIAVMRAAVTAQQISAEEGKLRRVEESIRAFVRAADPRFRQVVPMRFFNLILTPAEADAYCTEEQNDHSGVEHVFVRIAAVVARITTELEELRRAENSPSLWKLHADALIVLLEIQRAVNEQANAALESAQTQGTTSEADSIQASLKKLHECAERGIKTLSIKPTGKAVVAGGK